MVIFFFFFFQAEDGIRDVAVTGVQTCALPIYERGVRARPVRSAPEPRHDERHGSLPEADCRQVPRRSEEHTSELQSRLHLVCRLLLEKKKKTRQITYTSQATQTHIRSTQTPLT